MDDCDAPVTYEEFSQSVCELCPGILERFASGKQPWQMDANVQVQSISSTSNGQLDAIVTDGKSYATVSFASANNSLMPVGSVIQLIGMQIDNGRFVANDANIVANAADMVCMIIDSRDMRPVAAPSSSLSSSSSGVPDLFRKFQKSRSVEPDAPCSSPKRQATNDTDAMSIDNPIPTLNLISINMITAGRKDFVIGPVLVAALEQGKTTANNKQTPHKIRFVDENGDQIEYSSFSSFEPIERLFDQRKQTCYFVGRGVAMPACRVGVHPCEGKSVV